MAPPKKHHVVKLSLPTTFLETLPRFRASSTSTGNSSKISSPTPDAHVTLSSAKINSGIKELSTAGLSLNNLSNGHNNLDKSGKPCKKWHKQPRKFKTFSGFKVTFSAYTNEVIVAKGEVKIKEKKEKKEKKIKEEKLPKEMKVIATKEGISVPLAVGGSVETAASVTVETPASEAPVQEAPIVQETPTVQPVPEMPIPAVVAEISEENVDVVMKDA